jgi:hypothetical protein
MQEDLKKLSTRSRTGAAIATSTEADELVLHAKSFLDLVER